MDAAVLVSGPAGQRHGVHWGAGERMRTPEATGRRQNVDHTVAPGRYPAFASRTFAGQVSEMALALQAGVNCHGVLWRRGVAARALSRDLQLCRYRRARRERDVLETGAATAIACD